MVSPVGVSLSLHVRVTCLHSGSWLLSGFYGLVFRGPVFRLHVGIEDTLGLRAGFPQKHGAKPKGYYTGVLGFRFR